MYRSKTLVWICPDELVLRLRTPYAQGLKG